MRARWGVAVPVVLSTGPLLGLSLRFDERRTVYAHTLDYSANPLKAARGAIDDTDIYLRLGNFRPVGRFLDYFEHGLLFEASDATGLAPHVTNGIVRVAMLVLLAVVVGRLVERITAPTAPEADASQSGRRQDLTGIAMATVLVAGGFRGGLSVFSFLFIGTAAATLAIPMFVARERDLGPRRPSWSGLATVAVIGALAAATYDMMYLVPPVATTFLAARAYATRMTPAEVRRSAAARRLAALWVGFMAVFIPVRLIIADQCAQRDCYDGSEIRLDIDAARAFATRFVSAGPPTGWAHNLFIDRPEAGAEVGDILTNVVILGAIAGLIWFAARAVSGAGDEPTASTPISWRPVVSLVGFGASLAVMSAALVSLAADVQVDGPLPGASWRESVFSQSGIAIAFAAIVIAIVERAQQASGRGRTSRLAALAAVLGLMMGATLVANQMMAVIDRQNPGAIASNEIGAALVDFADSPDGNHRRCALADDFVELMPSGGAKTMEIVDELALARYGRPFCSP